MTLMIRRVPVFSIGADRQAGVNCKRLEVRDRRDSLAREAVGGVELTRKTACLTSLA